MSPSGIMPMVLSSHSHQQLKVVQIYASPFSPCSHAYPTTPLTPLPSLTPLSQTLHHFSLSLPDDIEVSDTEVSS